MLQVSKSHVHASGVPYMNVVCAWVMKKKGVCVNEYLRFVCLELVFVGRARHLESWKK